jgi:hypothetical protein
MTDIATTSPPSWTNRRRRTGVCGLASFLLLAAALKWAHHWNPTADLIVAGWGVTTAVAFVGGLRLHIQSDSLHSDPRGIGRFAKIGFAFAAMSVGALIIAAVAAAAGSSPPACGGG